MASLTEQQLKLKIQQRAVVRRDATIALKKITEVFGATPPDTGQAEIISKQLADSRIKLNDLDETILLNISDEQLEQEVERAEDYQNNILSGITDIEIQLRTLNQSGPSSPAPAPANHDLTPKLPKLEIAKYSGDPLLWEEFWDNFSSCIHERSDLPTIDKIKYLKSFLEGEALRLADGYRLTVSNYSQVVEALKERFGDPEIAMFSHFEALISLRSASYDLSELREVLDNLHPLILSKLPKGVKIELHRKNGSTPWRLSNLRCLHKDEINAREKGERIFATTTDTPTSSYSKLTSFKSKPAHKKQSITSSNLTSSVSGEAEGTNPTCIFCTGQHHSSSCTVYSDIESRLKKLQGHCHSCLRKGHRAPQCRSKRACYFCRSDKHHQSLCPVHFKRTANAAAATPANSSSGADTSSKQAESSRKQESNLSLPTPNSNSILQTALVSVRGKRGVADARLYFDTGASRSYVSESLASKIGAKHIGDETVAVGRFRDSNHSSVTYKVFEFDIGFPDGNHRRVRMSSESTISCPVQILPLDPNKSTFLSTVKLAEPLVQSPTMVSIDILVGNDYYYSFVGDEQIRCSNGVVLLSSPFGYIAGGLLNSAKPRDYENWMFIDTHHQLLPPQTLDQFWSLEAVGIKDDCYQNDDEQALQVFNDTVKFENGRYSVQWPWKSSQPDLPNNFGLAWGRVKSLLKRIEGNNALKASYNNVLEDQQQKGVIEEAPNAPTGIVHYIPHNCVIKPAKKTTKIRIVYDASAKSSRTARSLNECLYRGPVFLADSVGLLLRWRLPKIAIISDIEKAFLQISLQETQRDSTRFMWLKDINKPLSKTNLKILRFCRVPFGVISSPFLLAATVAHHLKSTGGPVAQSILENIYVDNVFGSSSTEDQALAYYRSAKEIFAKAAMNLREWYSNSDTFLSKLETNDRTEGTKTGVLGYKWDTTADAFMIPVSSTNSANAWTKRKILQFVASIYDPCGYLSPVTIKGKLLMQQLWKETTGWDDRLSDALVESWKVILEDLLLIPTQNIHRQVSNSAISENELQLHCFCDASTKAYSAVIYLRNRSTHSTSSNLIFAKARVAPIKQLTVPRLELLAVLIGVRMLKFVERELRLPITSNYVWSDSACVLHWIQNETVSTVFVQNRIQEIRSLPGLKFRHVPTAENPADISSRGIGFMVVHESSIWWHGPNWLQEDESDWPVQLPALIPKSETKPHTGYDDTIRHQTQMMSPSSLDSFLDLSKFSTLKKLYRVSSYVFRFVRLLRTGQVSSSSGISASEMDVSKLFWDKHIQAKCFPFMFTGKPTKEESKLRRELSLFIDSRGLIRCRYILHDASSEDAFPKLLPKNSCYTDLVIADCHQRLLHSGVKHTLAELRQNYWVIHSRNQVKRVLRRCQLCRIYSGRPYETPRSPPLPAFRIQETRAFNIVGIDYLGPLIIRPKNSNLESKVWICLFSCATVRAIHLEVVSSLSTEEFLLCLRRFMAHYGAPRLIVSDNASHFHLAQKTIHRLFAEVLQTTKVQSLSAQHGASWKFITELAPWMGGFYERMVGLVKNSLKRTIHNKCLTLTELQTVICEIATMLNSRPLLYTEEKPGEPYLTPAHFLLKSPTCFPSATKQEGDFQPNPISSDKLVLEWKRIQNVLSTIWKLWSTCYLQTLQTFVWNPSNRHCSEMPPTVGTVVIIKDSTLRGSWKLGVITELIPSHDNVYRSAVIRISTGKLMRRPIKLLYPLEPCNDPVDFAKGSSKPVSNKASCPPRKAADAARREIQHQLDIIESDEEGT